ncbi:pyridoxamine 5'-phosphate oxidase family protein [Streptomyces sp. NPDC051896]|uniref:pyridoxamine 5'-phosphate oxidase family protein n=1 Tax=Streptomyces sp. NPDC051896 TaxID=3155416 RepID=UPI00343BAB4B
MCTLTTLRSDGSPHVTVDADNGVARVVTRNSSKKVANVQAAVPCKARVVVCQVDGGPWVTLEGTAEVRTEAVVVADAVTALRKAVGANAGSGAGAITIDRAMGHVGVPKLKAANTSA